MSDIYTVKEKDRNKSDKSDERADPDSAMDETPGADIKTGLCLIVIYFLLLLFLCALVVVGIRGINAWDSTNVQNTEYNGS